MTKTGNLTFRYKLSIMAADKIGGTEIKFLDRQVRILIGRRALDIYDEVTKIIFIKYTAAENRFDLTDSYICKQQKGSIAFPTALKLL